MNAQTLTAIIMSGVMVLGMLGSLMALTYRMGNLSGRIITSMETAQRDRTEVLTQIGRLEAKQDRHIEQHHGGTK